MPQIRDSIQAAFATTGGRTVHYGGRNLSFVGARGFEQQLTFQSAVPPSMRPARARSIGTRFAELILHEVGHALGAGHSASGTMESGAVRQLADPLPDFSETSLTEIRNRLAGIASPPPAQAP
jgi:hypothetical protein